MDRTTIEAVIELLNPKIEAFRRIGHPAAVNKAGLLGQLMLEVDALCPPTSRSTTTAELTERSTVVVCLNQLGHENLWVELEEEVMFHHLSVEDHWARLESVLQLTEKLPPADYPACVRALATLVRSLHAADLLPPSTALSKASCIALNRIDNLLEGRALSWELPEVVRLVRAVRGLRGAS